MSKPTKPAKPAPKPQVPATPAAPAEPAPADPTPEVQAEPTAPPAPIVDARTGLRQDGPTLEEYVAAGYDAATYPPQGYAARPPKKVFRNPMGQVIEHKPLVFGYQPKPGQLRP